MYATALRLTDAPLAARELLPLVQADLPVDRKDLVVEVIVRLNDADVFDIILHDWTFLSPGARATVIREATQRAEYCSLVLRKAKADPVFLSQLGPTFRQAARTHKSESLRQMATDLFGTPESTSFTQRREKYAPALAMSGEAVRGRGIYQQRCASCHRAHSEGTALGPDLLTVAGAGRESLLTNILDPNREVAPRFEAWTAVLTDGEEVTGTLMEQNGERVVLQAAGNLNRAIAPADIKSLASSGRSLMPEGLDEGLTPEEMADLLRFIEELASPNLDSSAE
jgi:putative heme-binding domain-containing protein